MENDMVFPNGRHTVITDAERESVKLVLSAANDHEIEDASWFVAECARNGAARSPSSLKFIVRDLTLNTPQAARVKKLILGLASITRSQTVIPKSPRIVLPSQGNENDLIDLEEARKILELSTVRGALHHLSKVRAKIFQTPATGQRNMYRRRDVERLAKIKVKGSRKARQSKQLKLTLEQPSPATPATAAAQPDSAMRSVSWVADGLREGMLTAKEAAEILRRIAK